MRIETDRGAYRLVARREFVERARDRSFLVSTAITIIVLVGFIVGTSLLNRGTRFDLGVVGADARATAEHVVDAGEALGFEVTVRDYPNGKEAQAAVRSGSADAVLVEGSQVIVKSQPPEQLLAAIQAVSIRERARQALERSGLPPDRIDEVLNSCSASASSARARGLRLALSCDPTAGVSSKAPRSFWSSSEALAVLRRRRGSSASGVGVSPRRGLKGHVGAAAPGIGAWSKWGRCDADGRHRH